MPSRVTYCLKIMARTVVNQIRAIGSVAGTHWDPAALKTEQLNDQIIGSILEGVKTGQHPEWKDIADCSPTYKSYWAQWKYLALRNGILKRHWESSDGRSKIAQIILPWSRVNDVLIKLHGGPSGGHFCVNKTPNPFRSSRFEKFPQPVRHGLLNACRATK
jgi:hypothetical protein